MEKITLEQIAEDTGYSISTVSRALNGSNKISNKTRDTILKSAHQFEYRSPKAKNAHSSARTLNIALVATGFEEGEFYVSFFNGLNQAAKKNNCRLFLIGAQSNREEILSLIEELSYHYYDGILLFIPEFKRDDYIEISKILPPKFPVISNTLIENPLFSTITFDNYSGGHLAALHLEEKNHQKLGVIKGAAERAESRFRYNGFTDYIRNQQDMDLIWEFDGDFTFDAGHRSFEAFNQLTQKPTAIFACNDDMCNGFMEAGIAAGYNFPSDLAIIGYDDLPVCRHNRPTMSTIHTDFEQLGAATMKRMREQLSNSSPQEAILSFVPVTVCERDST